MPVNSEPLIEFGTSHRIVYIKRLSTKNNIRSIGKGIIGSQDEERTRRPLDDWTDGSVIFVPSNGGKAVGWVHNTTTTTTTTVNDDDDDTTTTTTTAAAAAAESTDNNDDGNKNKSNDNNIGSGYATICVVKIPLSQLEEGGGGGDDDNLKKKEHETNNNNHIIQTQTSPNWFTKILEYCRLGLQELQQQQQQQQQERHQVMGNDGLETNTNENNNSNRNDEYVYYKFTDQVASDIRNVLQQLDKNNNVNGDNDGTATTSSAAAAAASNKSIPEPKN
jgi:hypothetical protein